ncbi:hypothetical protein OS493_016144 [Desmophyllum pertusum]|uniref:C2 domain-containing protein n=1 Tax=Desmophyllum pertusum TaxID=174260 RepID=A0A9X0A595_9CNID|nr:hypothetical protein OS493_016144 [Desmophyllum pertusum]
MAQEEIAMNAGLDVDDQESKGNRSCSMKCQEAIKESDVVAEDLADMMPMVNEANAISQELDKKPYVVMKDLQTGVENLWPKAKFINRKYVMDEMYENFEDGDDWQLEDEKDPFTETPDIESLIGCVGVPMQSLGYVLDMREQLGVTDYKGRENRLPQFVPLNDKGKEITEEDDIFIDNPRQLEGKKLDFVVRVQSAKGLPKRYTDVYCKYSMYLEADIKTAVISGTRNPEFKYERRFTFEQCPPKFIKFLVDKSVIVQLWGKQVVDKKPVNLAAKKGKDTKAIMRAETLKKNNVSLNPAVVKGMAEMATLKKQNKRLQDKMNHIRQLCDKRQSEGKSVIAVTEVRAIIGENKCKYTNCSCPGLLWWSEEKQPIRKGELETKAAHALSCNSAQFGQQLSRHKRHCSMGSRAINF